MDRNTRNPTDAKDVFISESSMSMRLLESH